MKRLYNSSSNHSTDQQRQRQLQNKGLPVVLLSAIFAFVLVYFTTLRYDRWHYKLKVYTMDKEQAMKDIKSASSSVDTSVDKNTKDKTKEERKDESNDDDDDDDDDDIPWPHIAWLMSFPNSGTSYTMHLISRISNRTNAFNDGESYYDRNGNSIPLYPQRSPHGPFLAYRQDRPHLALPDKYVLTKTHCGSHCVLCDPDKYVETLRLFERKCLLAKRSVGVTSATTTTTSTTNNDHNNNNNNNNLRRQVKEQTENNGNSNKPPARRIQTGHYDITLVKRAIHLIRNPFNNIVARYHLMVKNDRRRKQNGEKEKVLQLSAKKKADISAADDGNNYDDNDNDDDDDSSDVDDNEKEEEEGRIRRYYRYRNRYLRKGYVTTTTTTTTTNNNNNNTKKYSNDYNETQAFREWCTNLDTRPGVIQSERTTRFFDPVIRSYLPQVPCHGEFFKFVQWHNDAFRLMEDRGIPLYVLHYENYESDFNRTVEELIEFLDVDVNVREDGSVNIPNFWVGRSYLRYYTKEERVVIKDFIKELSSPRTWKELRRYFEEEDNEK